MDYKPGIRKSQIEDNATHPNSPLQASHRHIQLHTTVTAMRLRSGALPSLGLPVVRSENVPTPDKVDPYVTRLPALEQFSAKPALPIFAGEHGSVNTLCRSAEMRMGCLLGSSR